MDLLERNSRSIAEKLGVVVVQNNECSCWVFQNEHFEIWSSVHYNISRETGPEKITRVMYKDKVVYGRMTGLGQIKLVTGEWEPEFELLATRAQAAPARERRRG